MGISLSTAALLLSSPASGVMKFIAVDNTDDYTVKITHEAQAASRTFTIPTTVTANADVYTAGATQTVLGLKTFTSAAKMTAATTVSGDAMTVNSGGAHELKSAAGGSIFLRVAPIVVASGIVLSSPRVRMPNLTGTSGTAGTLYVSGNQLCYSA